MVAFAILREKEQNLPAGNTLPAHRLATSMMRATEETQKTARASLTLKEKDIPWQVAGAVAGDTRLTLGKLGTVFKGCNVTSQLLI